MTLSVDTNILIYSVDDRYPAKSRVAGKVVDAVLANGGILSLQVCGEFYRVATRKLGMKPERARAEVEYLLDAFPVFGATKATTRAALNLAAAGRFSYWDANLVSAAEAAGCDHLFSEDMAADDAFGRLEIVNPFSGDALSERARELLSL